MSSNIPGDSGSFKIDITVTTTRPGGNYVLHLTQANTEYTTIRIDPEQLKGIDILRDVYHISICEMQAMEDNRWVPLSAWLGRRIRTPETPFEVWNLFCLFTAQFANKCLV